MNSPLFPVGARLLAFGRELQRAASFVEILDVARAEVRDAIGFDHAWLCVADDEQPAFVRVLGYSGSRQDLVWEAAPRIPIAGDPLMEEIFAGDGPVVVEDARTDPAPARASSPSSAIAPSSACRCGCSTSRSARSAAAPSGTKASACRASNRPSTWWRWGA